VRPLKTTKAPRCGRFVFLRLLGALWIACQPIVAGASLQIDWEVGNRFLLVKPAYDAEFQAFAEKVGRLGSVAQYIESQIKSNPEALLPFSPESLAWDAKKKTTEATLFRRSHTVLARLESLTGPCTWTLNSGSPRQATNCSELLDVGSVQEDVAFELNAVWSGGQASTSGVIGSRLIVGIGDSFASGEGNPDRPALLKSNVKLWGWTWFLEPNSSRHFKSTAEWSDHECHRSMLSWQALAALSQAINERKEVVRFIGFGCSGAEVFDGFLRAQLEPPGPAFHPARRGGERDGGEAFALSSDLEPVALSSSSARRTKRSQLNAVIEALCTDIDVTRATRYSKFAEDGPYWHVRCRHPLPRIDTLLVSIGGNDIGFSAVIKWALLPVNARRATLHPLRQFALDRARSAVGVVKPNDANKAITGRLPHLYEELADVFREVLGNPGQVLLLRYPDPLPMDTSGRCPDRSRDGTRAMAVVMSEVVGINFISTWPTSLEEQEVKSARAQVIEPLRRVQTEAARLHGWNIIDASAGFFDADGRKLSLCTVSRDCKDDGTGCQPSDAFAWARHTDQSSILSRPVMETSDDFRPFASDVHRRLRSANDAVAIQFTREGGAFSYLSGMFHPTTMAHAEIAGRAAATIATSRPKRSPPN